MNARTVHKTCNLCEAMCGLVIDVEGDRCSRIRGDEQDPISRGHICPKAVALEEIQHDPDRLRAPMRRTKEGWKAISWEDALDEAATRIADIQRKAGDDACALYLGNPGAHNFGLLMYLAVLNAGLATSNHYSASSLDQNPKHASSYFLFGNILNIPIPDIDRTDFALILGANPAVSNGSLFTVPGFRARARALRERGGRMVVIDPRRSETAQLADEHIFIRPGGDVLLLAGLLHTIFDEELLRDSPAMASVRGLRELEDAMSLLSPERIEEALGIEAAKVRSLAREFAAARRAVCYGRCGTTMTSFGTLNSWLIDVLNLLTGNLDQPGGAMFPTPAADLASLQRMRGRTGSHDNARSRVRGAPEFNGEFPTACLAEEITTPGAGQIRALVTVAGNPVLSAPNARSLDRAIEGLDFYVALDFYINETTRHADIILPPTWSLEHDNYEVLFHGFAVRNTAKYSARVLEPGPGALDEWRILSGIALRLFEYKAGSPIKRSFYRLLRRADVLPRPRRLLDWLLRIGPYGDHFRPWRKGLRLRDLEASPHGVDLGALIPSLDRILCTEDGRIALDHPIFLAEISRLEQELREGGCNAEGSMLLIGRRSQISNNSWFGNTRVTSRGGERCELLMHPIDAARLGIENKDGARVSSRAGSLEVPVQISDEVMQGVVSLPHGWGHDLPGVEMRVALSIPGANCNELTDDQPLESVVGNAILNGVPVEVSALERD